MSTLVDVAAVRARATNCSFMALASTTFASSLCEREEDEDEDDDEAGH